MSRQVANKFIFARQPLVPCHGQIDIFTDGEASNRARRSAQLGPEVSRQEIEASQRGRHEIFDVVQGMILGTILVHEAVSCPHRTRNLVTVQDVNLDRVRRNFKLAPSFAMHNACGAVVESELEVFDVVFALIAHALTIA